MPKIKLKKNQSPSTTELPLEKMSDITWRVFRIMAEFVEGFQFLSNSTKEVSVYGSARTLATDPQYHEAEKLGRRLAREGYTVITGGGPGIMEAANKGAYYVDPQKSIGLNIQLPHEQRMNPYVHKGHGFYYFFTRKVMLAASSQAYIFFPGGYGTLDEFSELITLIQTHKMQATPIILVDSEYWKPLIDWFKGAMLDNGAIAKNDLKLFHVVDTADEVMTYVRKSKERSFF